MSRDRVAAAEVKLGVRFPPAFVARMLRHNGGETQFAGEDWTVHPFFDDSDRRTARRTAGDIVRETRWAREHRTGFPPDAVVIARNDYGDLLVLRARGDDPGQLDDPIYLWARDRETDEPVRCADGPFELWESGG